MAKCGVKCKIELLAFLSAKAVLLLFFSLNLPKATAFASFGSELNFCSIQSRTSPSRGSLYVINNKMQNKLSLLVVLNFFTISNLFSQNKPTYPETQENLKRVDFVLPKIDNPEDYKVEISFSFEMETIECANTSFSFNKNDIEKGYGLDSRFPYYVFNIKGTEISEGYNKDCDKTKPKVKKKIISDYKIIEQYQQYFSIPYYIPKYWNLEYRIFKAESEFKTFK